MFWQIELSGFGDKDTFAFGKITQNTMKTGNTNKHPDIPRSKQHG